MTLPALLSCRFDRLNELIGMLEDNATDEAAAKAGIYSRLDSLVMTNLRLSDCDWIRRGIDNVYFRN